MTKEWRSNTLPALLARYSDDDVYNAHKMEYFTSAYQTRPTYTLKRENASRNRKESKDRLTVLIAANMSWN